MFPRHTKKHGKCQLAPKKMLKKEEYIIILVMLGKESLEIETLYYGALTYTQLVLIRLL